MGDPRLKFSYVIPESLDREDPDILALFAGIAIGVFSGLVILALIYS